MRFSLFAGAWGTGNSNPGSAIYDNFQLLAGTTGNDARMPNYGFEIPAVGYSAFQYSPTGGSWTFAGGSGVTGNGSGFTGGLNIAPEGSQGGVPAGREHVDHFAVGFQLSSRPNVCCNFRGGAAE
jgi:hypothetical protein